MWIQAEALTNRSSNCFTCEYRLVNFYSRPIRWALPGLPRHSPLANRNSRFCSLGSFDRLADESARGLTPFRSRSRSLAAGPRGLAPITAGPRQARRRTVHAHGRRGNKKAARDNSILRVYQCSEPQTLSSLSRSCTSLMSIWSQRWISTSGIL